MNKSRFKIVSIAILCTLLTLAGLQFFWLSRMYTSRSEEFYLKVNAAMERAAYRELAERSQKPQHVSARFTGLDSIKPSHINIVNLSLKGEPSRYEFSYTANKDKRNNVINITKMALSTSNDKLMIKYDSLLTANLEERDIFLSHKVSILNLGGDSVLFTCKTKSYDSLHIQADSIISNPLKFDILFEAKVKNILRLEIENPYKQLIIEMAGIIISSILIFIVLGFSFYYLLRTIFKQKTLEQLKSDFTRNITHELKTPIAVAGAANEALLKFSAYEDHVKRNEYLNVTQKQLGILADMVERILSISTKEQEDFMLSLSGCNIKEILQELIKSYSIKYTDTANKNINFKLNIYPDNLILQLDKFHFTNILSNLIDNAIKYSGEEVEIKIEVQENQIIISDKGIGISPQAAKRIFDKFYRIPTGNIHNVKGFGLGLYYTKLIVEKHGGTIEVISKPGEGSIFKITLSN